MLFKITYRLSSTRLSQKEIRKKINFYFWSKLLHFDSVSSRSEDIRKRIRNWKIRKNTSFPADHICGLPIRKREERDNPKVESKTMYFSSRLDFGIGVSRPFHDDLFSGYSATSSDFYLSCKYYIRGD